MIDAVPAARTELPQMTSNAYEEYRLTSDEQRALARLCDEAFNGEPSSSQDSLVAVAAHAAASEPGLAQLRSFAESLYAGPESTSLALIRNAPSVDQPLRVGALVASALGHITRYAGEGDYIIEIKEDRTKEGGRPSFANAREFFLHTDLSYVDDPPKYFAMQSVINNPDEGGISVFSDITDVIAQLDDRTIDQLQQPQFLFPAPAHYEGTRSIVFPILARDPMSGQWHVRFRRDGLRASTRAGITAVVDLIRAIADCSFEVMLDSGTVALINNTRVLHGRTAFLGAADRSEVRPARHLNRMYVGV